jgi:hypothetical protein
MIRRLILTTLALVFVLAELVGLPSAAQARPSPTGTVVLVDVSRAGQLPATKAIAAWNAGLTAAQLVKTDSCTGPGCIHLVEVFDGPTFLCSNPWGCGSSGGLRDGSCTVEVDRGAILQLNRRQYGNPRDVVQTVTVHELGHVLTGVWPTDGSIGFDCVGLAHTTECDSVMQNPLGLCGAIPKVPSSLDYARANALFP